MAFITPFTQPLTRWDSPSKSISIRTRQSRVRKHSAALLQASLSPTIVTSIPSLPLADDIYGKIFVGGIGIMACSLLGVLFVGFIIGNRLEEFEEDLKGEVEDADIEL